MNPLKRAWDCSPDGRKRQDPLHRPTPDKQSQDLSQLRDFKSLTGRLNIGAQDTWYLWRLVHGTFLHHMDLYRTFWLEMWGMHLRITFHFPCDVPTWISIKFWQNRGCSWNLGRACISPMLNSAECSVKTLNSFWILLNPGTWCADLFATRWIHTQNCRFIRYVPMFGWVSETFLISKIRLFKCVPKQGPTMHEHVVRKKCENTKAPSETTTMRDPNIIRLHQSPPNANWNTMNSQIQQLVLPTRATWCYTKMHGVQL